MGDLYLETQRCFGTVGGNLIFKEGTKALSKRQGGDGRKGGGSADGIGRDSAGNP